MSTPKLDEQEVEPEIVTATLVVADPESGPVIVPATSIEDPETEPEIRTSASEKLKTADKKAFLFAGYVFWAMIFVSGGATAAVLLARKASKRKITVTAAPSMAPTAAPSLSAAPTYAECSHDDIMEKLAVVFDNPVCTTPVESSSTGTQTYSCYDYMRESNFFTYEYLNPTPNFNIPLRFSGSLERGDDGDYSIDIEFSEYNEPCNFHQADEFFEMIEFAKMIPCSHEEIRDTLLVIFGENNCSTDSSDQGFVMGCELPLQLGAKAIVDYVFSSAGSELQPEALQLSYSEGGNESVVDLDLSLDDCTFDEASNIFQMIAGRCPEEKPKENAQCVLDDNLRCYYVDQNTFVWCPSRDCRGLCFEDDSVGWAEFKCGSESTFYQDLKKKCNEVDFLPSESENIVVQSNLNLNN